MMKEKYARMLNLFLKLLTVEIFPEFSFSKSCPKTSFKRAAWLAIENFNKKVPEREFKRILIKRAARAEADR